MTERDADRLEGIWPGEETPQGCVITASMAVVCPISNPNMILRVSEI
jgi:hypothetical protein